VPPAIQYAKHLISHSLPSTNGIRQLVRKTPISSLSIIISTSANLLVLGNHCQSLWLNTSVRTSKPIDLLSLLMILPLIIFLTIVLRHGPKRPKPLLQHDKQHQHPKPLLQLDKQHQHQRHHNHKRHAACTDTVRYPSQLQRVRGGAVRRRMSVVCDSEWDYTCEFM
jgi:ABC-type nickel/cobalt efflux system permease component RcnA